MPPSIKARWEMDLSPGTRTPLPASAPPGREISGRGAAACMAGDELLQRNGAKRFLPWAGAGANPLTGTGSPWHSRAVFPARKPSPEQRGNHLGETGMGHQTHLPQLRHALLRPPARSDRLSELRNAVRS